MNVVGWAAIGFLCAWLLLCHVNILILRRWIRELRATIATIRPTSAPDAVVRVSTTPDTSGTAERRTER